jgi:hypothetical protein
MRKPDPLTVYDPHDPAKHLYGVLDYSLDPPSTSDPISPAFQDIDDGESWAGQ